MRSRCLLFTAVLCCLSGSVVRSQAPAEKPLAPKSAADKLDGPPFVSAKGWAIIDGKSGTLLAGFKEAEALPIASTTKMMTAHLVFGLAATEPRVLDEVLTVSERAAMTTGSGARIKAGEKFLVRDLLYGLLLPSGNDAALAFAEHFGPRFKKNEAETDGLPLFVAEMNRQAAALKLAETKYLDPHGLSRNVSSPRDLAALAHRTMQDRLFREYVGTRRHRCEATGPKGEKRAVVWDNTNRLLEIEGYDGVKTGTTNAAGSCLVASGRRADNHLIVVVLGSTSNDGRYADARNLFRWAWVERDRKPAVP
jgi:serine-type D-Ala-D-Ala carboxypeptidase (penicillin-binding protein 5/6)